MVSAELAPGWTASVSLMGKSAKIEYLQSFENCNQNAIIVLCFCSAIFLFPQIYETTNIQIAYKFTNT